MTADNTHTATNNSEECVPITGATNLIMTWQPSGWQFTPVTHDLTFICGGNHFIKSEQYRLYQFMQAMHDKLDPKTKLSRLDSCKDCNPVILEVACDEGDKAEKLRLIKETAAEIINLKQATGHFRDNKSRQHSRKQPGVSRRADHRDTVLAAKKAAQNKESTQSGP